MTKSGREIMEILEAFDLTRCPEAAGRLAGCDPKTVQRYVARRDAGLVPAAPLRRQRIIDAFVEKIEELVDRSHGDIRADVVHHQHLVPMGFDGDERTTRRAVAGAKAAYSAGRRRTYRPWVPEPGMWLQFDWGTGPVVGGRQTLLFCAWLAWSRYRVVLATWDRTMGSLLVCIDATLRRADGAPRAWPCATPRWSPSAATTGWWLLVYNQMCRSAYDLICRSMYSLTCRSLPAGSTN